MRCGGEARKEQETKGKYRHYGELAAARFVSQQKPRDNLLTVPRLGGLNDHLFSIILVIHSFFFWGGGGQMEREITVAVGGAG